MLIILRTIQTVTLHEENDVITMVCPLLLTIRTVISSDTNIYW